MIKWHTNLKERTRTMKKKNPDLPEPFFKDKGETNLKENECKCSKNYAAIASINRKWYKLVREHEMLAALLAGSHFLYTIIMATVYNFNPFASLQGGLVAVIPSVIIAALFLGFYSNVDIAADVDKARKFLLETGQDVTYENINLIVEKYVNESKENGWNKIEDMLYENRKVPAIENVRNILGNSVTDKLNEAVPVK